MSRLIYLIAFTPSFERMRRFYEDVLGLDVHHELSGWVEYDTAGARLALIPIAPAKRGIQLRFESRDLASQCAQMSARGIHFEHDVERYEWGLFNEFWDPDGRLISLLQPTRAFKPAGGEARHRDPERGAIRAPPDVLQRAASDSRSRAIEPHWAEFDTGGTRGRGARAVRAATTRRSHASPKVSFAFEVEDLDERAEELRERGVAFAAAPVEEEFGVFAEILDPDGNVVVIREPVPEPALEKCWRRRSRTTARRVSAAFRKPVRKGTKATSRVALRPDYKTRGAKAQDGRDEEEVEQGHEASLPRAAPARAHARRAEVEAGSEARAQSSRDRATEEGRAKDVSLRRSARSPARARASR
jgi:predicted enzyme related to lactoylglutathione lyase